MLNEDNKKLIEHGKDIEFLKKEMRNLVEDVKEIKEEQRSARERENIQALDMRELTIKLSDLILALQNHKKDHDDKDKLQLENERADKGFKFNWATAIFAVCTIVIMIIQLVITYPAIRYANLMAKRNENYLRVDYPNEGEIKDK